MWQQNQRNNGDSDEKIKRLHVAWTENKNIESIALQT